MCAQLKRESSTGTASASSQSSLEGEYETSGSAAVAEQVVCSLMMSNNCSFGFCGVFLIA